MPLLHEEPPAEPEARVVMRDGWPTCGSCGRQLQHRTQWRCPWSTCRRWLYGTNDPPKTKREREKEA